MIINAYQMDMIKNLVYDDFIQRMVKRAKKLYPFLEEEMYDEDLAVLIRHYSDTAIKYDINRESNIEEYIGLCIDNPEMNMNPVPKWITDILSFPDMPEDMKIKKLSMYLKYGTEGGDEADTGDDVINDEFQFDSTIV